MIKDETRRVRQPAAWLLLAGVTISVFVGLMALLSDGFAAAANAGTLSVGGSVAGLTLADRAFVASHALTSVPLTAMAVVAVALATHVGEKVRHARKITLVAVILQGIALLLGVLTWLTALGFPASGSAKLAFFLEGTVGIMVAAAGLFFSVATLRSGELQQGRQRAAPHHPGLPRSVARSAAGHPGYGYGQQGGGQRYPGAYQSGSGYQAPDQQTSAQKSQVQAATQTAEYQAAAGQQYGAGPDRHHGEYRSREYRSGEHRSGEHRSGEHRSGEQSHQGQALSQFPATYGQQAHEAHGQQAPQQHDYQGGYSQQSYGRGYEDGYGPGQSYGRGYAPPGQQGYGQEAADAYQTPGTDVYRSRGTDIHQPAGTDVYQSAAADAYQPAGTDVYQSPAAGPYQPAGTDAYQSRGTDTYERYYQQPTQPADHGSTDGGEPGHSRDYRDSRDHG